MTRARQTYFASAAYRRTIKIGDRLLWLKENGDGGYIIVTGEVIKFDSLYIRVNWLGTPHRSSDLQHKGGAMVAFRMEDLTEKEKTEIVTLRLST